ncbi:GNAT family N-acetyltransferase [Ornithinicoccus hortensis]|uniref:Acetyltransferase (GNAT) family protein n=1 Tax=Ornithinicoccus hortensis TaxID=82346 RepID=A0A542YWA4_9MICO|nr:GNAT family N-acetyltransferase [Ornithinicoccus hortensis]TQL52352.1 hypothetical protein FB467_3533 [Ornithinicoccus hortensis]
MDLSVRTVPPPRGGEATSPLVAAFAEVYRRHCVATFGDDDLADSAEVTATAYAEQTYRRKLLVVALDGERVVGGASFGMPLKDNTTLAEGDFAVDPDADPGTVLPAVWEQVRAEVVAAGRRTAQVWMSHPLGGDGELLVPRTGAGRLPRDKVAGTLLELGFELEQVERHSVLDVAAALPRAATEAARAREVAGSAYEVLSWVGPTPEDLRAGMADLMARMSTDVPSGDLELEPEEWDAERVATGDRVAAALGRRKVTSIAREVATGQPVAYTEFVQPGDKPQVAYQEDTLVHAGHRGHRLGMLVKAANLAVLARELPDVARVHTWNATENAHMLAINHALGFTDRSAEGGWQLTGL